MPPLCWISSTCLEKTAFDRTWLAFSRGKSKPSKLKKISSTKAKKAETSEQGDAHFKVVLPKPLSRNRRELDRDTEPEGRRQGHNTRPDDGVSFLQRLNPSLNAPVHLQITVQAGNNLEPEHLIKLVFTTLPDAGSVQGQLV